MGLWDSLASVGTSILNNYAEDKRSQIQRDWSAEMMDKQNQWSLDMWNRTNEYNSPLAQRQRLEEAGLNPLYYGLDGSSANALESAQPLQYQRASSSFANPLLEGAQTELVQAQISKTNEEAMSEVKRREKLDQDIKVGQAEVKEKLANAGLTSEQQAYYNKINSWYDRLQEANLGIAQADKALKESEKREIDELLEGKKIIQSKSIRELEQKWKNLQKEFDILCEKYKIAQKDVKYYALIHMTNGALGTGISLQNLLWSWLTGQLPDVQFDDSDGKISYPNPAESSDGYDGVYPRGF